MKEKFKVFASIYAFLLGAMILAIVFAGDIDYNNLLNISESQYPYLAIPFVAIAASEFLYRNKMKEINSNSDENGNTGAYQTASLMPVNNPNPVPIIIDKLRCFQRLSVL